jgi:hypothetical protein
MPMEIQDKFIVSTNLDESFWESSFVHNYITDMINKYHEKAEQKKVAQRNVASNNSNHIFHCHNINMLVVEPEIVVALTTEIKARDFLEKP